MTNGAHPEGGKGGSKGEDAKRADARGEKGKLPVEESGTLKAGGETGRPSKA